MKQHLDYCTEFPIKVAWGNWIDGMADWQIFSTLTMRDKFRESDSRKYSPGIYQCRRMIDQFLDQCRLYSSELSWVTVFELQKGRDVWHTHSLVAGPFQRSPASAVTHLRRWSWESWGRNRIERFKPRTGASGYLGRYLVKGGDVEFSPDLSWIR